MSIGLPIDQPGGHPFMSQKAALYNRTGETLTEGQVALLDTARAATESTDATHALTNAAPVATANLGSEVVVCGDRPIKDDAYGIFVHGSGPVKIKVAASQTLAVGDQLTVADGEAEAVEATAGDPVVADVLEAVTTGAGETALVFCRLRPYPYLLVPTP